MSGDSQQDRRLPVVPLLAGEGGARSLFSIALRSFDPSQQ